MAFRHDSVTSGINGKPFDLCIFALADSSWLSKSGSKASRQISNRSAAVLKVWLAKKIVWLRLATASANL